MLKKITWVEKTNRYSKSNIFNKKKKVQTISCRGFCKIWNC